MLRHRPFLLLVLLVAFTAHADVRVFLPVYIDQPVPGAFGSLWATTFAVHNGSNREFIIEWCSPDPSLNIACPLVLPGDADLRPGDTKTALPSFYPKPADPNAGSVLYIFPEDAPQALSFQLHVKDQSRSAVSAGTEVPVVQEADFKTLTLHLLNIPVDDRFRLTARLYEMNLDDSTFAFRVYDQDTNAIVGARIVTMHIAPQGLNRFHPAYSQIDDLNAMAAAAIPKPKRLRIELEPKTPGVQFWAYVSITNNETQQVTLITPN